MTGRTHAHDWQPDFTVVDAVIDGRRTLRDLAEVDRAVVVAQLTERGETVATIASRLDCSTRMVKRVRSWSLTRAIMRTLWAEQQAEQWREQAQSAARARQVEKERYDGEVARLRSQV